MAVTSAVRRLVSPSSNGGIQVLQLMVSIAILLSLGAPSGVLSQDQSKILSDFQSGDEFGDPGIVCLGDAARKDNALELTNAANVLQEFEKSHGRCMYSQPVGRINSSISFSTHFEFTMLPTTWVSRNASAPLGDGLAFILVPNLLDEAQSELGYLGWINSSSHSGPNTTYAVEFDTRQQEMFSDPSYQHVGLNKNSLNSMATRPLVRPASNGSLQAQELLNLSVNSSCSVWIDYDADSQNMSIALQAFDNRGLLDVQRVANRQKSAVEAQDAGTFWSMDNVSFPELWDQDLFVGLSSSTGGAQFRTKIKVTYWRFKSEVRVSRNTRKDESHLHSTVEVIVGITIAVAAIVLLGVFLLVRRSRRAAEERVRKGGGNLEIGDLGDLVYGPQSFSYKELSRATHGFNPKRLLGSGGFGSVYLGKLSHNGGAIAVKRVSRTSRQGTREFLSEAKTIGKLRHRNLVPLLGWCYEREELLLVYELMPNGSLDSLIFKSGGTTLGWDKRYKILCGVAAALVYLHEEWEQRVVHRDVKASNVMLDSEFNARLGDFGLARVSEHDNAPASTIVAGTLGYLAPEFGQLGKATDKTDVFSFGAVALEVACSRRALDTQREVEEMILVDWVWNLYKENRLMDAADSPLLKVDNNKEVLPSVNLVLRIGLMCSHPDPLARPSMRRVLRLLKGEISLIPNSLDFSSTSQPNSGSIYNLSINSEILHEPLQVITETT